MANLERAVWEIKNEKNKAGVRWLLVLIIAPYMSWLLATGRNAQIDTTDFFNWPYIAALTGGTIVANILVTIAFTRGKSSGLFHPAVKYATMLLDLAVVTLVVLPTGGSESIFFVVYFIVIVSNSLRYGMRLALTGVLAFNVMYVAVLMAQYYPNESAANFQKEILKVGGFWLVGLYTGYLSRRFEILQGEVEKYQKLLARAIENKGDIR
ncbi:MAG: hypothetical protein HY042_04100 [Spirochaetia bacterium]|nr:hypothetical protein [Spirochaetia bacterium]